MKHMTQEQVTTNRLNAINKLHKCANELISIIEKDIIDNGYKVKKDFSLYAKDSERISNLIKPFEDGYKVYIYLTNCEFSGVLLKFRIHYITSNSDNRGCHTCSYYSTTAYLNREGVDNEKPIYDVASEVLKLKKLEELENLYYSTWTRINTLKSLLIGD